MNVQAKESTDLVVLQVLTPAKVFAPGSVDEVLGKIKSEVAAVDRDISTDAGRKAIASTAYKIARSKTALDKMGKELGETHYKSWKAITAERARIENELDALKDEFRKPLTDWENAEKQRIAGHEAALAAIPENSLYGARETVTEVRARLDHLTNYPARNWQEFGERAKKALDSEIARTRDILATVEKREAEAAELERLRAGQIAREQAERDARIAAEAAEKARREAEEKARAEAEAAERRAREERERIEAKARAEAEAAERKAREEQERLRREQERVEREKAAAERSAREAEERAARAEQERIAAEERAKREAEEAARRAEQARIAAAEKAERDRMAAIEAERKRVADEKAAQEREAAAREANKRHRAKINNEVLAALVAAGLSEDTGKLAITAIAQGSVPHTRISY